MPKENEFKSPLNEAIGKYMYELRRTKELKVDSFATEFGLTNAYIRQIESGSRALPPYCVVGLVNLLGFSWRGACELVSVVSYLDTRKGESYDFPAMSRKLQKLKATDVSNAIMKLLNYLKPIVDGLISPQPYSYDEKDLLHLRDALDEVRMMNYQEDGNTPISLGIENKKLSSYKLSPFIEDIVDTLSERLSAFPPLINAQGIEVWERANQDRICGLVSFISDHETLMSSIESFDWAFMWNRHSPKLKILIGNVDSQETEIIEKKFRDEFLKKSPPSSKEKARVYEDICNRVHLFSALEHQEAWLKYLRFSYLTNSMPGNAPSEKVPDGENVKSFQNAWVYEILTNSITTGKDFRSYAGYLSTYEKTSNAGYAVSMNREHIDHWINLAESVFSTRVNNHND